MNVVEWLRDLGLARYEPALEVTIITMAKGCCSSVIQQAHRRQVNFVYARADDLSDSGVSRRDQVPLITRRQARGRTGTMKRFVGKRALLPLTLREALRRIWQAAG